MNTRFPEIFYNPSLINDRPNNALMADMLCAWAICHAGQVLDVKKIPDSFGVVLIAAAEKLGMTESPTPENCMKFSKRF